VPPAVIATALTPLCASCLALPEVAAFHRAERRWRDAERQRAAAARTRFDARAQRLSRLASTREASLAARGTSAPADRDALPEAIRAALERARRGRPR